MSEAELKRLERKRATLKAKLTTTSTFFNETKVNLEGYDAGARSASLIEVQLRIDKLEEVFIQYEEVQGQIEVLTDKFEEELTKREQFETAFYKLVALMKQLVQENQSKDEESWNGARSNQSESSTELRSFVDQISKNLRSLEILGQPTDQWDTLLVYLVTSKLDTKTMREWEEKKGNEVPTFEDMKKFLRTKSDLLETLDLNKNIEKQKPQSQKTRAYLATAASKCPLCQQEHQLFNCSKFLTLSPQQRVDRNI
ncbi:hypothetical protein CBL_20085 [Carabus blaptoides fortunei]